MTHVSTRAELYRHVAQTTGDVVIRDNINHGRTVLWGRFKGGWVLETWPMGCSLHLSLRVVVGIKITGAVGQHLISGRLSDVPWADYIGGEAELDKGDFPEVALKNKKEAEK